MSHRGSKRCVLELVDNPSTFLPAINMLIQSSGATIKSTDSWLPVGLKNEKEAELKDFLAAHFSQKLGLEIENWWLAHSNGRTRTPNWDLISTCSIDGEKGILLVEAKAHHDELETGGKPPPVETSLASKANHEKILLAINQAKEDFNQRGFPLKISRDKCYQLSNRIAHAWWLANEGIPVVLLYLGFLNAEDMRISGYRIFTTKKDWEDCIARHISLVNANQISGKTIQLMGKSSF
jgi:hypothetical protein